MRGRGGGAVCEGEDEGEQCVRGGRRRAVCEREGEQCECGRCLHKVHGVEYCFVLCL